MTPLHALQSSGRVQLELAQRALASQYLSTEIIPFSVNVLYLEDASGNRVLFDAGNGPNGEFGPGLGRVVHTLEASGISRHSITHVLISHAHLDHIGGVLLDTNGTLAYPGAKVYVSRQEYEYWRGAGKLFNASDIDPEYLEFLAQGANDVFDQVRCTRTVKRANRAAESQIFCFVIAWIACMTWLAMRSAHTGALSLNLARDRFLGAQVHVSISHGCHMHEEHA